MSTVKERVRMALAEAGYPDARISNTDDDPYVTLAPSAQGVPPEVLWQAFRLVAGDSLDCRECWVQGYGPPCRASGVGSLDCGVSR